MNLNNFYIALFSVTFKQILPLVKLISFSLQETKTKRTADPSLTSVKDNGDTSFFCHYVFDNPMLQLSNHVFYLELVYYLCVRFMNRFELEKWVHLSCPHDMWSEVQRCIYFKTKSSRNNLSV